MNSWWIEKTNQGAYGPLLKKFMLRDRMNEHDLSKVSGVHPRTIRDASNKGVVRLDNALAICNGLRICPLSFVLEEEILSEIVLEAFCPKRLLVARTVAGMSQAKLGKLVDRQSKGISSIERSINVPGWAQFLAFCLIFDVSPAYLCGRSSFSELDNRLG